MTLRNKKNGINTADAFGQGKCIFTRYKIKIGNKIKFLFLTIEPF